MGTEVSQIAKRQSTDRHPIEAFPLSESRLLDSATSNVQAKELISAGVAASLIPDIRAPPWPDRQSCAIFGMA
ncbi:hypothetical protein [Bradyrhizobium sp. AS23.2]|uniref:hypothetical protein n=1 Tax=Bradyrhizobium sp. AS23.2 TaxID=1680155 RepID=UPI00093A3077|nr:hypothetical protein [Bradyrhizobium sp. AS23.2]OKO75384.1 hypothetical protein AC630_24860 [Bradyrhizobium sp. AS23.2]